MNCKSCGIFGRLRSRRHRHVWLGLVLVLSSAMVLWDCMQFTALSGEGQSAALEASDRTMEVTLKDGSRFRAEAHHYLQVTKPSAFIYASGTYRSISGEEEAFAGKIEPAAVETVVTASRHMYRFSLNGGSTVACRPEDCLFVDSAGGTGLWLVGIRNQGRSWEKFQGKVDDSDIASIEFLQASSSGGGLLVGGGIVLVMITMGLLAVSLGMRGFGN